MRPLLENRTPKQLLWIIAASNALTSLGFAMIGLLPPPHHHVAFLRNHSSSIWMCFPAILIGLIATLFAEQSLKDGVASEQWPEALLVAPRKLFEHSAISTLGWSLIVASFLMIVFTRSSNVAGAWVFLAPALSLQRISSSLRPRSNPPSDTHPLYPLKPLQSEHWGTPPRPLSN
jgi:hypothetical protein